MSTLTDRRPAAGGALLFFLLLFVIVWASLPPLAQPGPGDPPPASSASPAPPPPPDWRWGGRHDYDECPGTAMQHVLCRHGASSKAWGGKFNTNSAIEVRRLVKTAMKNGELFRTERGWKVVYDFSRNIGKDFLGKPTKRIEIYLSEMGDIMTAFPK